MVPAAVSEQALQRQLGPEVEDDEDSIVDDDDGDELEGAQGTPELYPAPAEERSNMVNGYEFIEADDPRARVTSRFARVFWMGDLNYRIDGTRQGAEHHITAQTAISHATLLHSDQLKRQLRHKTVFAGFQEGPLNFLPTYKFDKGSDRYDSSKKQRIPAWTDRVLQRSSVPGAIEQLHYNSVGEVRISDHRPVQALFDVKVEGCDDPTLVCIDNSEIGKASSQVCNVM